MLSSVRPSTPALTLAAAALACVPSTLFAQAAPQAQPAAASASSQPAAPTTPPPPPRAHPARPLDGPP
ncbi:MAG: hypothetical protein QM783_04240 [Phycisphaerales bacterium]